MVNLILRPIPEHELQSYGAEAKQYTLICVGHAHIDMDWQWSYEETVATTIDTFQTMLNLMREFPDFIFSQSQASVYEMIEKYAPDMLDEIRHNVAEGRWEVIAGTWVEHDKNMSGTEAMVRQLLYTRRYLSKLLNIDPLSLDIDFEPDTFGHSAHVPEILSRGGVKYYYHCRGDEYKRLFRWRAPSGAEVLACCEPNWYLGAIEYDMASFVPSFCRENHTDTAIKLYGVGDHGGGPTRRDLTRIQDMSNWPLMPRIRFGKIRDFFKAAEKNIQELPLVDHELNYVFTGCYTSQSRIKQANRYSEDRLYDVEALGAMARLAVNHTGTNLEPAWRMLLYNQFHDILPGSCIRESREHALGMTREIYASATGYANRALKRMCDAIDTSLFGYPEDGESTAEGAGAGMGSTKSADGERAFCGSAFHVTDVSRGGGLVRAYTVFNPTAFDREEPIEITLWDWKEDLEHTCVSDSNGVPLDFEITGEHMHYWRHEFVKLVFMASVPGFGYATYYIHVVPEEKWVCTRDEPRLHRMEDQPVVLQNNGVRAEFDSRTMKLIRFSDLRLGNEVVTPDHPAGFFEIDWERNAGEYSAWIIGGSAHKMCLNDSCKVNITDIHQGALRQWIDYSMSFLNSSMKVRVQLDAGSSVLRYSVELDWHEFSRKNENVPRLCFTSSYAYPASRVRCDVPGGYLDREKLAHDIPICLYATPINDAAETCLMLTSDCKYGCRFCDDDLCLSLVRASNTPDRYPEFGVEQFEIGLGLCVSSDWTLLSRTAFEFSHPLYPCSNSLHSGILPPVLQLLHVNGRCRMVSLKITEDGKALLLRMNGSDNEEQTVSVSAQSLCSCSLADLHEHLMETLEPEGDGFKVRLAPKSLETCIFTIKNDVQ